MLLRLIERATGATLDVPPDLIRRVDPLPQGGCRVVLCGAAGTYEVTDAFETVRAAWLAAGQRARAAAGRVA